MALSEPANGWIARHDADCRKSMRQKCCFGTQPRGSCRSFTACVPAANNNNVERSGHCRRCLKGDFGMRRLCITERGHGERLKTVSRETKINEYNFILCSLFSDTEFAE